MQPPDTVKTEAEEKKSNAQPLGPPPKPATSGAELDYFSGAHGTHFQAEANPFEASFGGASSDTPGKSLLPPVASLTSPSSLLPGGTPGWAESLRSGPLSPAMLPGPTGGSDYFGQSFRGSFPTPNESSLRTGLTPGGGGSMFPAPSPNSQLILNSLQSGGATPGTLDFHRTALTAAAAAKQNEKNGVTSQPEQAQMSAPQQDPFGQHDANDAANGLYMLAQANGARNNFAQAQNSQSVDTSPLSRRGNAKDSIGSADAPDSESGESEHKPATRSRGGKKAATNGKTAPARRKAEETPVKPPANKKARANSGGAVQMEDSDDEEMPEETHINGRKMTDEEKRKNFLERNRYVDLPQLCSDRD